MIEHGSLCLNHIETDNNNRERHRDLFIRLEVGALSLFLLTLVCILLHFIDFIGVIVFLILLVVSIVKPNYPLYFLALILPFFGNNPGGKYTLYFIDIIVMLILLRWLVPLIWAKKPTITGSSLGVWIWLFFIVTIFSLIPLRHELAMSYLWVGDPFWFVQRIYTAYAVDIFWSIRHVLDLFISILFFYFVINNLRSDAQLRNIGLSALAGLLIAIISGILDFHKVIDLTFFRPLNPDIQRFGYNRLMSLFYHSDWFAQYMIVLAPFFLAPFFINGEKGKKGTILLGFLILYAVIFTYQRAAWFAFLASLFVLILFGGGRFIRRFNLRRLLFIFFIILFILLAGFYALFLTRAGVLTSLAKRAQQTFFYEDRTRIWHQALLLYEKKPLFGVGAGNYYYSHRSTFPPGHPYYRFDKVNAHNTYLQLLTERGPFALILFLILLYYAMRAGVLVFRKSEVGSKKRIISGAAVASLTAFAVYGMAQYIFYIRIVELIFWFVLGLVAHMALQYDYGVNVTSRRTYKAAVKAFVLLLFILLVLFQPSTRDLFFWNEYKDDEGFMGSWVDSWNEFRIRCSKEVIEARFVVLHPDVAKKPVHVDMLVNGKTLATFVARDNQPHKMAAIIPPDMSQPLRIRFRTDRVISPSDLFPGVVNRRPYNCIVGREIESRSLGLRGVGFSKWEKIGELRYRWTTEKDAVCDIMVTSPVLVLRLSAANPDLAQKPLKVTLALSEKWGKEIDSRNLMFDSQRTIKEARFSLSPYIGRKIRLNVRVDRLFCPMDSGKNDTRYLGVYVSEPLWEAQKGNK